MTKRTLLLTLLALIAPSALFAANATPIYVWGFGDTVAEVFKAVSQAVNAMGANLTAVAAAIGGIIVIFKYAGAMGRPITPFDLVKYPIVIVLLQQLFLSATLSRDYMVIDETTNTPYSVGNLPVGIGETFSMFSSLQRSILMALDEYYTTPNSISFRNAGLGFGMSVHDMVAAARPLNPAVMMSFNAYMEDCLVNESYANPMFRMRINSSSNLLEDMKVDNNFLTTYYSSADGSPSVEYCPNAWTKLQGDVTLESKKFLRQLANSMGYNINPSVNPSSTEFGDRVGLVAQQYFGMSQDAESYVNQSMLANMDNQAIRTMSAMSGINLSAMAWMTTYTERKAQGAFYSGGMMAKKYMPMMQTILFSIVICVSWILALLTIATHNVQYIRLFLTLTLTISLWMIIASIMNFNFDLQLEKAIKSITYNVTSGSYQIGFKNALDTTIGDRIAMLGYISWLIPVLAFALAKGSDVAFAGLFSALGQAFGVAANQASGAGADRNVPGGHSLFGKDGITVVGHNNGATTHFDGRNERYSSYNGDAGIGDSKTYIDEHSGHVMQTITTQSGASWTRDLNSGQVTQANLKDFNANVIDQEVARETNELAASQNKMKSAQENWANTAQSAINDQVAKALSSKEGLQTAFAEADKNGYGDQFRIGLARATLKHWDTLSQHLESSQRTQEFHTTLTAAAKGDLSAAQNLSNYTDEIDAITRGGNAPSTGDSRSGHDQRTGTSRSGSLGAGAEMGYKDSSTHSSQDSIGASKGDKGSHQTQFAADATASIARELSLSKQHMGAYEQSLAKTHSEAASKLNSYSKAYSEANTEAASAMDKISAMKTLGNSFSSNTLAAAMNGAEQQGISNDAFMGLMINHISSGNYEAATSMVTSFAGSSAHSDALTRVNEGRGAIGSVTNNTDPNFANANLNADPKAAYDNVSGVVSGEYGIDPTAQQRKNVIQLEAENFQAPMGTGGANEEALKRGPVEEHLRKMEKGASNIVNTVKKAFD
jgi:conjugal transfer mating pair stabilization protein TraG